MNLSSLIIESNDVATASNNADAFRNIQELQQRMARIEVQQGSLERDLKQLSENSDNQHDAFRTGFATKDELRLHLENLRLTIDALKIQVSDLTLRLGGLETNIVKKVEDIGKKQQEDQVSSMRRLIAIQSTILVGILAAVLGVVIPILFHR